MPIFCDRCRGRADVRWTHVGVDLRGVAHDYGEQRNTGRGSHPRILKSRAALCRGCRVQLLKCLDGFLHDFAPRADASVLVYEKAPVSSRGGS